MLNADDGRVAQFGGSFSGRSLTYGLKSRADVQALDVITTAEGCSFSVDRVAFRTALIGRYSISNVLAGLAVAKLFGFSLNELTGSVAALQPGKMRGERTEVKDAIVYNDAYNSNPEAAAQGIDVLLAEPALRKIAVLGEMLELGAWSERLHRDLGRYAAERGVHIVIGVQGDAAAIVEAALAAGLDRGSALFFEDAASAGDYLRSVLRQGDAVLLKGSRGAHLERALKRMEE